MIQMKNERVAQLSLEWPHGERGFRFRQPKNCFVGFLLDQGPHRGSRKAMLGPKSPGTEIGCENQEKKASFY